jgi:hypothetical protein
MLIRTLTVSTSIELLDTAYKYNLERLKQLAKDVIFANVYKA